MEHAQSSSSRWEHIPPIEHTNMRTHEHTKTNTSMLPLSTNKKTHSQHIHNSIGTVQKTPNTMPANLSSKSLANITTNVVEWISYPSEARMNHITPHVSQVL